MWNSRKRCYLSSETPSIVWIKAQKRPMPLILCTRVLQSHSCEWWIYARTYVRSFGAVNDFGSSRVFCCTFTQILSPLVCRFKEVAPLMTLTIYTSSNFYSLSSSNREERGTCVRLESALLSFLLTYFYVFGSGSLALAFCLPGFWFDHNSVSFQ